MIGEKFRGTLSTWGLLKGSKFFLFVQAWDFEIFPRPAYKGEGGAVGFSVLYFLQQLAFSELILYFSIFFSFQETDVCVCVCWGLVAWRSRPSLAHQSHVQIRQENMKEEGREYVHIDF
jgi:hypothetical protein